MSQTIELTRTIYPKECLDQAIGACAHLLTAKVIDESSEGYTVAIEVASGSVTGEQQSLGEFLNHLLEVSVERYFGLAAE